MKILVTGKGGAGSWAIRGTQLGSALGATVKPFATQQDFADCDITVVVKRTPPVLLDALVRSGKPWVYDIVDCYPQPQCSGWNKATCISWVRSRLDELGPHGVIWPTHRMRIDCDPEGEFPSIVLPHHHRPEIERNPIREHVKFVGYEGNPKYLSSWHTALDRECQHRGWTFVVNPERLSDVDIVVAFRAGEWNGYAQKHWKSNVKAANAHASGTPFIGQMESGYLETATGCEYWAETPKELSVSFDWLESQSTREQISDRFVQASYPVEKAASELAKFLRTIA